MNIYDNIDTIYYINLKKRQDRNEYIKEHLKKYFHNINIIRFEAIEPNIAYKYEFIKEKYNYNLLNKFPGIIGCYSSHMCILKRLFHKYKQSKTNKFVLIFEDDTFFNYKFINILKKPFNITNWNILLGINPSCNVDIQDLNNFDDYLKIPKEKRSNSIFGTNLVIYNLNNISTIYKKMLSIPKIIDIDIMIRNNISDIHIFNTKYILEHNSLSKSDIRN